jgi:flagellin-like hook-associated protein FlgL
VSLERLSSGKKINGSCDDAGFMDLVSTNLEAAYGRIMDPGVAAESTRFSGSNILVQSSASMTAQANQLSSLVLTLIE